MDWTELLLRVFGPLAVLALFLGGKANSDTLKKRKERADRFRYTARASELATHKFRLARAIRKRFGYLEAGVARLKLGVVWR